MNVRRQVSMVFHLDKCIGCHTCTVACKNLWTDRKGAEYMWWNNVETKPGTGYPTQWENQSKYQGGWEYNRKTGRITLKHQGKLGTLTNIFYNPNLPEMDDYYTPWTYQYRELFEAAKIDDQPTARPISMVTGEPVDIEAGPNWDDDLSGSPLYAANDINLYKLTEEQREKLLDVERMVFFYLPRICNHCVNPACAAACPSGAIYKRGEDGIVLIDQEKCRGWRMCVTACPYKKTFYNWNTGKSEKCILCFPRLESGQAPACFHSCVGRIRYLGVVLYDAEKIPGAVKVDNWELVEKQRELILDPHDPEVIAGAKANGIGDEWIKAAQKSPVYKFVKEWQIALPLHAEFRTLPMLFYIPPLLPVMAFNKNGQYETAGEDIFADMEHYRLPMRYMASLFSAGNVPLIEDVYRKLMAVRIFMRSQEVDEYSDDKVQAALKRANMTAEEAEAIHKLTSLPTFEDRFVLPPYQRESEHAGNPFESMLDPLSRRGETGFGFSLVPKRGL
ncbi:MAG TPA: nitrate reductase subunit beta [Bacilli bacterium]